MKRIIIGILIGFIIAGISNFILLPKPKPEIFEKTIIDTIYTKVTERDTIVMIMQPDIVYDTVFVEVETLSKDGEVTLATFVFDEEWSWVDTTITGDNYKLDLMVVYSHLFEDFEIDADIEVISDSVVITKIITNTITKPPETFVPVISVGGLLDGKKINGFYLGAGGRFWNKLDVVIGVNTDKLMGIYLTWKI